MPIIDRRLALVVTLGALVSAATACGSTSAPPPVAAPATTALPRTLDVALTEWDLVPSSKAVGAGKVTINAKNDGKFVHEVVLFKTDLDPSALPLGPEGEVDERGAGIEFVDEVEDVQPGESASFAVDLSPGTYLVVCNAVDNGEVHYAHKMFAPLTVQ